MGLCESEVSQYLLTFNKLSQNVIIWNGIGWYSILFYIDVGLNFSDFFLVVYNTKRTIEYSVIKLGHRSHSFVTRPILRPSQSVPLHLVRFSLDERIYVSEECERELKGWLHTNNQHLNLGDVKETFTTAEINKEKYEEVFKFSK